MVNSSAKCLCRFAKVVAAQPGTVQAITENGDHRASEAQQKSVRTSQGMAAKPLAASPLDSPPLQKIVGLQVHELVEGAVRGRLKQSAGEESEDVDRDHFSLKPRQKQPPISPDVDG